jgi:hypothetical protein
MLGGGLLLAVVLATPAGAHDPIFVDDATALSESPIIGDGSISFATYGTIAEANRSAHVRLDLADGDTFGLEVLVPDQPPENGQDNFSHLTLAATAPDGSTTELRADGVIDRFDEPFTNTSYLRVIEFAAPAVAGTYELTITSTRPTRFTVATGQKEQFGTEVANYQRRSLDAVAAWYETPPPTPAPTTTVEPTTTVSPPPPPSSSTTSSSTTSSTTSTSVAPSAEPGDADAEIAAPAGEPASGPGAGAVAAVLAIGIAALVVAAWWLTRRRRAATDT